MGTLDDAAAAKDAGLWWSDIIPPFYVSGATGTWDSLNWDSTGQTVFENHCKMPGEPEETFLEVVKNIPNVVEDLESYTITFTLSYIDPDTITGGDISTGTVLGVVDTCDITFTAGETKDSCKFLHLTPGAPYVLEETDAAGFTPVDPYYFYGGDWELARPCRWITASGPRPRRLARPSMLAALATMRRAIRLRSTSSSRLTRVTATPANTRWGTQSTPQW